jgi:hypothetical protein
MIDTDVGTYHGVNSLSRMGGLLVHGYYYRMDGLIEDYPLRVGSARKVAGSDPQ